MEITNKQLIKIVCNWIAIMFFIMTFITNNGWYLVISNIILIVFATTGIKGDTKK